MPPVIKECSTKVSKGTVNSETHETVSGPRESDSNQQYENNDLVFPYPNIKYVHHVKDNWYNIHIRTIELNDAEEIFSLIDRNRESLRKWLPWVDYVKTVDDERRGIERFIDGRQFSSNIHRENENDVILKLDLCSVVVVENKIVGTCSYNQIIKNSTGLKNIGFVGYWLGKKWEGLGIITSAVERIIDYGFKVANLDHINISVAKNNKKSLKVVERLSGFEQMDSIKDSESINGTNVDLISFLKSKPNAIGRWRENRLDYAYRDSFKCY